MKLARVLLLVLLGLVLTDQSVFAQAGGIVSGIKGSNGGTAMPGDSSDHTVRMKCISGCGGSGGTSMVDNAAFTGGTDAVTPLGAIYDTTPPAVADGSIGAPRMNSSRQLYVECAAGCSGGTQYSQGTASTATDTLTMAGAIRRDTAALDAGVIDGDRAGLSTDSVGRLRVTSADTTQPVSGTVTANAGTGNFTVVQPTGTNLHIVCDSGCGGGTQYAEDSIHASGDQLTMAGVVQQTADSALAADGDRTALQVDANGYLKVNIKAGAGSGGTASTYGAAFPATGTAIGFSDGTNMQGGRVVDGDSGAGTVYVQGVNLLKRASGGPVEAGTSTDPLRVDPTGTTTQPISAVSLPLPTGASTLAEQQTQTTALQLLDDAVATTAAAIPGKGLAISGTDGTNARVLKTDTGGELQVDVLTLPANASVNVAQMNGVAPTMGNGASGTGVQRVTIADDSTGQIIARGNVAHDGVDSGNPVKVGAKAIAHGTNPTAVAAADRTDLYANRAGILWTIGGHPNAVTKEAQVEDADGAQTNAALVTVSAGTKIVVTRLSMSCDGGNTGPINAVVGFGTASVPARAHTGSTGVLHGFDGIPAGGGITIGDGSGILGVGADDEDLRFTMEDPAGGSCSISATYYTIES